MIDKHCRNGALCGNLSDKVFRACLSAICAFPPTATARLLICSGTRSFRPVRLRTHFWTPEADRWRNLKLLTTRVAATKHNQLILCLFLAPTVLVTTFYTYPQVTRFRAQLHERPTLCHALLLSCI